MIYWFQLVPNGFEIIMPAIIFGVSLYTFINVNMKTNIDLIKLIDLSCFVDHRGSLTFAEYQKHISFEIKRFSLKINGFPLKINGFPCKISKCHCQMK